MQWLEDDDLFLEVFVALGPHESQPRWTDVPSSSAPITVNLSSPSAAQWCRLVSSEKTSVLNGRRPWRPLSSSVALITIQFLARPTGFDRCRCVHTHTHTHIYIYIYIYIECYRGLCWHCSKWEQTFASLLPWPQSGDECMHSLLRHCAWSAFVCKTGKTNDAVELLFRWKVAEKLQFWKSANEIRIQFALNAMNNFRTWPWWVSYNVEFRYRERPNCWP